MGTPIRSGDGRHVIGRVEGSTFVKPVRGSIHKLRTPVGWAVDVAALEQAQRAGAVTVCVLDSETDERFTVPLPEFWRRGVKLDRGFGPQLALPIGDWLVERAGEPVQLELFGG